MPRSLTRALHTASFLLVMSGYLALATTSRYSAAWLFLPLLLYAAAPLGEYLDAHSRWYGRVTAAVSMFALLAILASLSVLDLLTSVTLLVVYIQGYTLLHRKRVSNYHHLHLMAFFLLLAAFVQSPEPEIGPVIILFVLSTAGALMTLHINDALSHNEGIGLGEVVPLGTPDSNGPMLDIPRHGGRAAAVFAAIAAMLFFFMGGLFYLTPRMEAGLLGRSDPALFRTGPSRTVDLAQGGTIQRSQAAVMHVEFPGEPDGRYDGELFWRGMALDAYSNGRWQARGVSSVKTEPAFAVPVSAIIASNTGQHDGILRPPWEEARSIHQSIYMDEAPEDGLPCLTMAQRVSCTVNKSAIRLGWSERGDYSVVTVRRSGQRWIQYDAWSDVRNFPAEQLRNAPENYRDILAYQDLATLTAQDLLPETQRLAQSLTRDARTAYDKAAALNTYLSGSGFSYTLNLPPLPADHPIDAFISTTKRGHCELYASALALMLRSVGVPTRVVAGYRGGDWSEADRAYTVRADMAHLWCEVYFPGCGWVAFDPSPPDTQNALTRSWLVRTTARYILQSKMFWYRNIVGFDRTTQFSLFRNIGLGLIGLGPERMNPIGSLRMIGLRGPWIVPALFVAGIAVFFVRRHRSRAADRFLYRRVLTADQMRAVRLFRTLRRRMKRMGISADGRTAEELQRAIEGTHGAENAVCTRDLIDTYNQVRFGGRPLSREHYARLKRLARALRKTTGG